MWINEIVNVVVENKNKKTFYEKSLWANDDMNIVIQFAECCNWGAIELTSEQYESIEETSSETDTYDTQYNSSSHYDIKIFEKALFTHHNRFVGAEFCTIRRQSQKDPIPENDILKAMLDLSWFEVNYGVCKYDVSKLSDALSKNGWAFLDHSYSINGDLVVTRKNEYDYLWINDDITNGAAGAVEKDPYGLRISFLNNQEGS